MLGAAQMFGATVRLAFRRQLAYRAANLAGLATNLFFGALRAAVLLALFAARPTAVPALTVQAAVSFTGFTQACLAYVAIFGWWDLMRAIRSGDIASDLLRPYDVFWYWFAQDVGRASAQLLVRGLPIVLAYALVYPLVWPPTVWHWLAFGLSLALGLFISFAWRFMVNAVAFWTQDAVGVGRFAWGIAMFASGFIMPLALFPDWLATALTFTPFPNMFNFPISIALGWVALDDLWRILAMQVFWAVVLYGLAHQMLAAGLRKLVVQGG